MMKQIMLLTISVITFNCYAETVVLKTGEAFTGDITSESPRLLKMRSDKGKKTIEKKDILCIGTDILDFSDNSQKIYRENLLEDNSAGEIFRNIEDLRMENLHNAYESIQQDQWDTALSHLSRAEPYSFDKSLIFKEKARVYASMGKYDQAEAEFEKARTLSPDNTEILLEMGRLYIKCAQYYKAQRILGQALMLNPDDARIQFNLGTAYFEQDNYRMAEKMFLNSLTLNPLYYDSLVNLGGVYYTRQEYDRAVEYYLKAIRLRPSDAAVLSNLAASYMGLENKERALFYYGLVVKILRQEDKLKEAQIVEQMISNIN